MLKPMQKLLAPPDLMERVRENNDWFAECQKKWRGEHANIGAAAKAHRQTANLSLRETARRMGVSAPFLSDLELGKRNWTVAAVNKWLKVMRQRAAAVACELC